MTISGVVSSARVTHDTAAVDELAAATPESQPAAVSQLLSAPGCREAYVLATCNRVEAYVVTETARDGWDILATFFDDAPDRVVETAAHEDSLTHLLRVASGLESVVLGEDQIIGQVRTAYEDATAVGGVGDLLEPAVTKAIHVGERARTETTINEGIVSLGSAAVELAGETIDVDGVDALVVGAGEMGQLAARALESSTVGHLTIANRTIERAESVRETIETPGTAVPLSALAAHASEATLIVTATGSDEPVLGPDDVGDHEQVIVDLGQPRDVDPATGSMPETTVYDLDDLESLTRKTREQRQTAADEVESMIEREFGNLLMQLKRARADEAIAAMYESATRIKDREVQTALHRLEDRGSVSDEEREIVESMADAVVNQLLSAPTESLRDAAVDDDWETIDTALRLFNPAENGGEPEPTSRNTPVEHALGAAEDD
ncbi:glutamyl-tRNA reductase [Halovivax ruber XH-70]|uniref:Glutamyl-tRNA reductase n=1 Tax=Halovivax ruber (strain DSM 18193 / JCM 13892 / XH-70) TaxID=797302 RepID=L0IDG2_HALRX|nr:glutamyl-tRNA reductase [Halovivax ruber]AGB16784.1 glutamyl-tRNA reductase [Halovivax ruber XH-70]